MGIAGLALFAGRAGTDGLATRSGLHSPRFRTEMSWRDANYWERSYSQTPTVLGVHTERYKLMRYQGIWDRYELYDLQEDPDEMNNLLGDYLIKNQVGPLDRLMQKTARLKAFLNDMNTRLDKLLKETGASKEPNWRHWQGGLYSCMNVLNTSEERVK